MCQFTDSFYSAVRILAGDGNVKQRLLAAYVDNLEALPEAEAPDSIRASFINLRQALTAAKPLGGESAVAATVRKMSSTNAAEHAAAIVAMFSELVRVKATGERLRLVSRNDADDTEIPPHVALN